MTTSSAPARTSTGVDLILGTAGHIDHGKSTLICALTGTDPDRLAEEKRRGITITLGFAQLELPDGRTMGVVDVPGHEHFVKQMIAGATGIDVALLVIAADDGVMPQTIEHVAVLQTLGITSCVVALTKIDAVDTDWIDFMRDEVRSWLATTAYAQAPIVPVSARTKAGLPDLLKAIEAACKTTQRARGGNAFRMPIDRAFQIKGAGTVVTGTLWSGAAMQDSTVEILPAGTTVRVRSVQMHNTATEQAAAGNRVAINLANVSTNDVAPGDFLAEPGLIEPTDRFDARLTYLCVSKTGKPLETGARMHIAHGTREVIGRVLFCNGKEKLESGESTLAQIRLDDPLPVCAGDRFVVRTYSPVAVAGGGAVTLAHPRRTTTLSTEEVALREAIEAGDIANGVEALVALAREPQTAQQAAHCIGIEPAQARAALDAACAAKRLCRLDVGAGGQDAAFCTKALVQKTASAIEKALIAFHTANPEERGMTKEALRQAVAPRVSTPVFDALIAEAVALGKALVTNAIVSHPTSAGGAAAAEEQAAQRILEALEATGMNPKSLQETTRDLGLSASISARAITALEQAGKIVRINRETGFSAAVFNARIDDLRAYLTEHGSGTVADLKTPLATSRKFAVPILEYLDAQGITAREGDARTLRN